MNAHLPLFERINEIAEKNGKSFSQVEKEAGFPRGSLKNTKNHAASIDTVMKLADYFDMSIDELIGRTEANYMTKEETRLLSVFRNMNAEGRAYLMQTAELASGRFLKTPSSHSEVIA